jgi:hypothetical protein
VNASDVKWALTEAVDVTNLTPGEGYNVLVARVSAPGAVVVTVTGAGNVLLNGVYVDLGDDLPSWLGILDEAVAYNEFGTRSYRSDAVEA